jgi:Fe-S-cluster containining protein
MELSSSDIERLEEAGYSRGEFAVIVDGVTRLRNVDGWCYFYSSLQKNCRVYRKRPLGCYLYPVVYMADEGATVDELCPMGYTVSEQELRTKGKILVKLLKNIDNESKCKQNPIFYLFAPLILLSPFSQALLRCQFGDVFVVLQELINVHHARWNR